MNRKLFCIVFLILDIVLGITLFVFNFIPSIREKIILSSIDSNKWLVYTLYSENTVSKVINNKNQVKLENNKDLDKIVVESKPLQIIESEYDEAILTKDNDNYKLLNITVGGYKAYLVAIYDPSKVQLIHSKTFNTGTGQEKIKDMCVRSGGLVCINGGMFVDNGVGSDIPMGYLIKNGKVLWRDNYNSASLIGFTNDNKLLLINATAEEAIKKGMRDALEFGPFLIVNGKRIDNNSAVGGFKGAARVAIAQRKDGIVLFLVTEGNHSSGPTMGDITDTLLNYGAYNAANLDGGASSQLAINGQLINNPKNIYGQTVVGGRSVVSGFGLIP
ncbi:MAG: phosphodiester glycosidase family protein [Bacilli bacterium]|nr:phosphodiester glycosidase family protein [Bacilli bacterium]